MAIALRFVNKEEKIVERFLGIVHVNETSSLSLKISMESLLIKYGLNISRIRGQGYDGASNMRDEFNRFKSLILSENSSAFYVHCFTHQLQLTLVAVVKNHIQVASFFNSIAILLNVVGESCKRHGMLREKRIAEIKEALGNDTILSGRGLNQERSLKRLVDVRWGSHYGTILNIIIMFSSIIDVLDFIREDGLTSEQKAEATGLLDVILSFDFIFNIHLMKTILRVTNELSVALQRKDQDIVNSIKQVKIFKKR
ncbi:hypothetical protein AXF42_Ash001466 [Apostasia shenzhenica]|uniref:DUF4371 domain-containing protein n=1 Tax=Apostasia shenzhenica TaxID=1088818 RepID=A0A2I0AV01_9ASPA|nr:hypothetical protein AXF42_Ash001466 [Apostasia shenzhenica]